MFYVILGTLLLIAAVFSGKTINAILPSRSGRHEDGNDYAGRRERFVSRITLITRCVTIVLGLLCYLATSFVHVGAYQVGMLNKKYGASDLAAGAIVAVNGEKGPQARILAPGWNFSLFVNVINDVTVEEGVNVPEGKVGYLIAFDGVPLRPDQFMADEFPSGKNMLDAETFLKEGGQKGPQTTVLPPGYYRLNKKLFGVTIENEATTIAEGTVGVIKSNVVGPVRFGNLATDKPAACYEKKVTTSTTGEAVNTNAAVDDGKLTAVLVPVGCVGIWDTALQPGRYYLNKNAYNVTIVPSRVLTWEYRGGFRRRFIDLSLNQQGELTQTERHEDVKVPDGAADSAITPRIEGWVVPLELRVLAQVTPENAAFVVAAVGGVKEIEDNIMTPTIRSVVRNVVGATGRRVLDLADNRAELESAVEKAIRPEGLRAGIVIKEIKFGDPVLPPELLVSRLRQQLAEQLKTTYEKEQDAQQQRIATEKARATANQQNQLVAAEIGVAVAKQNKDAAQLRGEGVKLELLEVAKGQAAQAQVLGEDRVLTITLAQEFLKALKEKPELVKLVEKLVPDTVVTTGSGGGLDGAAGILGALIKPSAAPAQAKR